MSERLPLPDLLLRAASHGFDGRRTFKASLTFIFLASRSATPSSCNWVMLAHCARERGYS